MLFVVFLPAAIVSALISRRLCAGTSAARIYGGLLGALVLSVGITAVWFLHRFVSLERANIWQMMTLAFQDACLTFPLLFLGLYWIFMSVRRDRKPSPRGALPMLTCAAMLWVALSLLTLGVYASRIEPNWIEVTNIEIRTPHLKAGAPPLRIVHLSDLHIDEFGYREKRALEIVKRLDPDIIVLTGDYTNFWERYPDVQRFMKGLHARYGVYAVHGNWHMGPRAAKFFEGTRVKLLHYETEVIRTRSGRIVVAGVPWYGVREAGSVVARENTRNSCVILLSHIPDAALYAPPSVDLVLAGHTHGGQVRLPGVGPVETFSEVGRDRSAGLSRLANGGWLYVNRGLGMEGGRAPRIRFLCRPEITVLTIRPGE